MSREIAAGVHLLEIAWPEPIGSNAYLVDDGEVTLVDTGLPIPRRSIASELTGSGYKLSDVDRILITHYDVDHVGGLARLNLDVPVYLGVQDVALVRRESSPSWLDHKGAFHRLVRRWYSLSGVDLRPVLDGEQIGNFRAIHTPGHNPGHLVYLHEEFSACLLGDLVWEADGRFVPPPWIDSYDVSLAKESIHRVAEESFDHGCMAHGEPVSPDGDAPLQELASAL